MAYKHDYDKTLTRLVNILRKLYNGESLSVKELALEFNVSDRTIQRDFNNRLISFPIEKDGRRWKMQDGFKLEKTTSIEEQIVLDIMENLVDGVGKVFSSKAKNLLSKIKNKEYNPIYAKLNMENIDDKLFIIQDVENSIKNRNQIFCTYKIEENRSYTLTINPLKIANYEGFWYLIAIDTKDDTIKKYYLKNIVNIRKKEEKYKFDFRIEELLENSINVWFDENTKPFVVKLYIDPTISKFIKRKPISNTQVIESNYSDGSLNIEVKITHEMEILPIIKYWIPYIKVIEPLWINDILKKDLENYKNILES